MSLTIEETSADLSIMRIIQQAAFGVIPPTPNMTRLRMNSHSLVDSSTFIKTGELTGVRGHKDSKRINRSYAGSLVCESSFATYDELWAAMIGATGFTAAPADRTGTYATDAATGAVTGTGVGAGLSVGQFVLFEDFGSDVDREYKLVAVSDDAIVVDPKPATTLSGAASRTVRPFNQAKQGNEVCVFFLEEEHTDTPNTFFQYLDAFIGGASLTLENGDFLKQNFELVGTTITPSATTARNSETLANSNDILAPARNLQSVMYGIRGSSEEFPIRRCEINLNPNARPTRNANDEAASGVNHGKLDVDITLEVYFKSIVQYQRFIAEQEVAFAFVAKDKDNNRVIFDMPRLKIEALGKPNPGTNGDIIETITLSGLVHLEEGCNMSIHTLAAP